jgi:hypothetical protein
MTDKKVNPEKSQKQPHGYNALCIMYYVVIAITALVAFNPTNANPIPPSTTTSVVYIIDTGPIELVNVNIKIFITIKHGKLYEYRANNPIANNYIEIVMLPAIIKGFLPILFTVMNEQMTPNKFINPRMYDPVIGSIPPIYFNKSLL